MVRQRQSGRRTREPLNQLADPAAVAPAAAAVAAPAAAKKKGCTHPKVPYSCQKCRKIGMNCPHKPSKRYVCLDCVRANNCLHGRRKDRCKECGGKGSCPHGRRPNNCKDCSGASICLHGKRKNICVECKKEGIGGSWLCAHNRQKHTCKICSPKKCEHKLPPDLCTVCLLREYDQKKVVAATKPVSNDPILSRSSSSSSSSSSFMSTSRSSSPSSSRSSSPSISRINNHGNIFGDDPVSPTYAWLTTPHPAPKLGGHLYESCSWDLNPSNELSPDNKFFNDESSHLNVLNDWDDCDVEDESQHRIDDCRHPIGYYL